MAAITDIRKKEQTQMQAYMNHKGCLMAFLEKALDDPDPTACGKCVNCNPSLLLSDKFDADLANQAAIYLKRSYQRILPRKKWPFYNPMPIYGFSGNIKPDLQAEEGQALCLWRDAGWGELVRKGKYDDDSYGDELVNACVEMIEQNDYDNPPKWVTCIPSKRHPTLVPDFAKRVAKALELPFIPCIEKVSENHQQKKMENSFQQAQNLDGVFQINLESKPYAPCFLVDDMVDSKWTLTVASALLRQAGCEAVYPLTLVLNSPRMD